MAVQEFSEKRGFKMINNHQQEDARIRKKISGQQEQPAHHACIINKSLEHTWTISSPKKGEKSSHVEDTAQTVKGRRKKPDPYRKELSLHHDIEAEKKLYS